MAQHLPVLTLLLNPSVSLESWCGSMPPSCVSVALGLLLSDQLSTQDSTRSLDGDPWPGLPRGCSAVHIHFHSAAILNSSAIKVAPPCTRPPSPHTNPQIHVSVSARLRKGKCDRLLSYRWGGRGTSMGKELLVILNEAGSHNVTIWNGRMCMT